MVFFYEESFMNYLCEGRSISNLQKFGGGGDGSGGGSGGAIFDPM
jgi:hypothetical protein